MFTFCDFLRETKQIPQTNSRESAVRTGNHLRHHGSIVYFTMKKFNETARYNLAILMEIK